MRIYLDACCLSRLTDDQSQIKIRKEAEAVELLLAEVQQGRIELVSGEALEDEVRRNPSPEKRAAAEWILSLATCTIEIDAPIARRARALTISGYGPFDALHIASAESAGVDVLFTTDERLLRRATRKVGHPLVSLQNPLSWSKEQLS